jgi:hypothetical protein
MPNFNDQTIVLNLSGVPNSVATPASLIPSHIHKHSELAGLAGDDHPQYLDSTRGATLFDDLFCKYLDSIETPLDNISGENAGNGIGVFKDRVGDNLQFYSLVAGTDITLTRVGDTIVIGLTNDTLDGGGF